MARDIITQLRKKLYKLRLDALFVSSQPNISYITGLESRDAYLLITKRAQYLITDFRYEEEAKKLPGIFKIAIIGHNIFQTLCSLVTKERVRRMGFEAKSLSVAELKRIKQACLGLDCIYTFDLIESFRQVKGIREIAKIRKAIARTAQCLEQVRKTLRRGRKEIDIQIAIESLARGNGVRSMAFETIVAFGRNGSMPHYLTGESRLKSDDPVLIDMGVNFEGYNSDITRVFKRNCRSREFLKIYDTALEAQELAISAIRPGICAKDVDHKARGHIASRGYGKFFRHSLGHGVGLEAHELPYINSTNMTRLLPGMVFTVEPGIYLPGKFGVRIEDMVLVTEGGCEVLTTR